jgi:hypothetical protein
MSAFSDWNGPGGCCPPGGGSIPQIQTLEELIKRIGDLDSKITQVSTALNNHANLEASQSQAVHKIYLTAQQAAAAVKAELLALIGGSYSPQSTVTDAIAALGPRISALENKVAGFSGTIKAYIDAIDAKLGTGVSSSNTVTAQLTAITQAIGATVNPAAGTIRAMIAQLNTDLTTFKNQILNAQGLLKIGINTDEDATVGNLFVKDLIDFTAWKYLAAPLRPIANMTGGHVCAILGQLSFDYRATAANVPGTNKTKSGRAFIKFVDTMPWNAIVDMSATPDPALVTGNVKFTGAISALAAKTAARREYDKGLDIPLLPPLRFVLVRGSIASDTNAEGRVFLGVICEETIGVTYDPGPVGSNLSFFVAGINFKPLDAAEYPVGAVYRITHTDILRDGQFSANDMTATEEISTDKITTPAGEGLLVVDGDTLYVGDKEKQLEFFSSDRPGITHANNAKHMIAYLSDLSQSIYWQRAVTVLADTLPALNAFMVRLNANDQVISPDLTPAGYHDVPGVYTTDPYGTNPTAYLFVADDVGLIKDGGTTQKLPDGFTNVPITGSTVTDVPVTAITGIDHTFIKYGTDGTTVVDANGIYGRITSPPVNGVVTITRIDESALFTYTVPAYATFNGTAWVKTDDIPIPDTFDGHIHDVSYEWSGMVVDPDGDMPVKKFTESYITWTAHHQDNVTMTYDGDPWASVNLPLEGYRSAAAQDAIDNMILGYAISQPDYNEQDDTVLVELPDRTPRMAQNPAFIQNRPWTGLGIVDGGSFSDLPLGFSSWLVDGGDFTGVGAVIPGYTTPQVSSESLFKNAIIRLWRGNYADMPEIKAPSVAVWNNFAHTLRWCDDKKELWYSDGTLLYMITSAPENTFKVIWNDGSWEWIQLEPDGGGHFYWSSSNGVLRFDGPNNDTGPILWEEYAIIGGGPNFTLTGGSRVGTRLITALDENDIIRRYYTVGQADASFTEDDEIATVATLKVHIHDTDNPHQVTAEQIGLGNVDNTADDDKPVSQAQAEYIADAVANAQLATQTWLPSVQTKASLPTPSPTSGTYLCRVLADPLDANNGTWQWIGTSQNPQWVFFESSEGYVTESELNASISAHNTSTSAHSALFAAKQNKVAAGQVKDYMRFTGIEGSITAQAKMNVQERFFPCYWGWSAASSVGKWFLILGGAPATGWTSYAKIIFAGNGRWFEVSLILNRDKYLMYGDADDLNTVKTYLRIEKRASDGQFYVYFNYANHMDMGLHVADVCGFTFSMSDDQEPTSLSRIDPFTSGIVTPRYFITVKTEN